MSDNRKTRCRATRMGFIFQHYNLLLARQAGRTAPAEALRCE